MTENERYNSIMSKIKPCLCGLVPSLKCKEENPCERVYEENGNVIIGVEYF